ncbi:hypothetical protein IGI04_030163 [Brassica rapa subsp. trilocularis]|uniref:Uncharacterized protein n=1 Tax=Brassica rapa subsp. trilocularis TaxID=1813537 RepID=A0ABQ7LPW8_BRACM|nr:hypothetical protein IGI04_030163 [Brassica rapa subsp. trilocularis]
MIGQPMIPHSFNIHHPSQAITQTHTGQRQAYTKEIHIKPNLVPKPDLGLNYLRLDLTRSTVIGATLTRGPEEGTFNRPRPTIVQPPAEKLSLKITGTCTQQYQHAIIENIMHPSPSPSQTRSTLNSKWNSNKPTHSVLGEKLLSFRVTIVENRRLDGTGLLSGVSFGQVWMLRNDLGSWGIYRRHQPISFRLVAARVSLRMAPDASTATPRAPHGWLHVQDTCRTPPLLPDVRLHDWSSCKAPHILTHVDQHASIACVATFRAWPIHLVLHMACCMSRTHAGRHNSSQMSGCMTGTHARRHSITHMAGRMLRFHARRHLVLGRSTSCFYVSGCMDSFHARLHLPLVLTLSFLDG